MSNPPTVLRQITRSRGGCVTCKKRRKKCDETKPVCLRCIEGKHVCLGYEPVKHRKGVNKPSATHAVANATTVSTTTNLLPLDDGFLDLLNSSSLSPAEVYAMSPLLQSNFREHQTQPSYSVLDTGIDLPAGQSSHFSTTTSPLAQSQVDSLAFLSALSGPSMFAPPERNRASSPSRDFSVSRPSSPSLMRVGKVFTHELWNNLLNHYSFVFTRMGFDWRRMGINIGSIIQTQANRSPVIRNGMLAIAAYHLSYQERSEAWKWRQMAHEFISDARKRLGSEIFRNRFSAERKFEIVMKLLNFELHIRTSRAESTRALLEQCKDLIIEALGSSHINIGSFRGFDSLNYAIFAWIDIKISMVLAKPTLLTYHFTNLPSDYFGTGADACRVCLEAITYCPDEITVCLFHISALREYALADLQRDGKLSEMTHTSAQMTEDAIRAWQATPASFLMHGDPQRLTIMECWRLTALIYLYQAVYRVGPLHSVLSDCVEQIIAMAKAVPQNQINDPCLLTPYFFVGTAAVKQKDRAFIRARLAIFPMPEVMEYVEVLDKLWAKTDLMGAPTSWGEIFESLPLPKLSLE